MQPLMSRALLRPVVCRSVQVKLQKGLHREDFVDGEQGCLSNVHDATLGAGKPVLPNQLQTLAACPCCGEAHVQLPGSYQLVDGDIQESGIQVQDPLAHVQACWTEVPLGIGLEEEPSASSIPLRLCAAPLQENCSTNKSASAASTVKSVKLTLVADPLALAQRARLAIYPPWQLGPNLRFSWRLQNLSQAPPCGGQPGNSPYRLLSNQSDMESEPVQHFLVPLRPHQLRSLAWMRACEHPNREPLLLGAGREFQPVLLPPHASQSALVAAVGCKVVARVQRAFPVCGGLLADQVGSGKTAVTLALLDMQPQTGLSDASPNAPGTSSRCTLVLAPSRLLEQWKGEVQKFVGSSALQLIHVLKTSWDLAALENANKNWPQLLLAPFELLQGNFAQQDTAEPAAKKLCSAQPLRPVNLLKRRRLERVVIDEFHELLAPRWRDVCDAIPLLKARAVWGLSGTLPVESFRTVASMASLFSVDLEAFRHQLDAHELAQKTLDYLARSNSSEDLDGIEVREEIISLHHTPAERAIYSQVATERQTSGGLRHREFGPNIRDPARVGLESGAHVDADADSALLQLCSHFRLDGTDAAGGNEDAETECAQALRHRAAAAETAREWLVAAARRMEEKILLKKKAGSLDMVSAEQHAQLLAEIGLAGKYAEDVEGVSAMEPQVAGARAAAHARVSKAGLRYELEADQLICAAIQSVRNEGAASVNSSTGEALDMLEEVRQAKETFRQCQHSHAFLRVMLEAAEADQLCCPVCLAETPPIQRAMLAGCAHLFCLSCASKLATGSSRECALCRQSLRGQEDVLLVREPGAVLPAEREERRRWGRFGSKLFHVVKKIHAIESENPCSRMIVFVQWASLRRRLAAAFCEFGVPFVSLEEHHDQGSDVCGTSIQSRSFWERDDVVTAFQSAAPDDTSGPKVLLLSLQDAASGTNLTRANHVIFVHPMSASSRRLAVAYEMQALGRCVRLGQSKPVFLWRFVTRATVEEEISLRHQEELWSKRPELWSGRQHLDVNAGTSSNGSGGICLQENDHDVDLDDLFW